MTRTRFQEHTGVEYPIICGPMYPCSNPELVAAVSEAGGLGVIQPVSLTFVYKYDFKKGLEFIRTKTQKPIGLNLLIEKLNKKYEDMNKRWLDLALENGVRFFVTSLGNPKWVADRVHAAGGVVYHDVVDRKWALKAVDARVDGLICVNGRAGGHAGSLSPEQLMNDLRDLGLPLICAGGIGSEADAAKAIQLGYAGVQMGTRFIATTECKAHPDYKTAIVKAQEEDIVLTEKLTGVPVAIIATPTVKKVGTKAGFAAKFLLKHPKTKHWMRLFYQIQSLWSIKNASLKGQSYKDYWQAGKSVGGIERVEPAGDIVKRFGAKMLSALSGL